MIDTKQMLTGPEEISKNLSSLQISTERPKKPGKPKKEEEIADSWEDASFTPSDDEESSSTETEETDLQPRPSNESPSVPPPTPSSPTSHTFPYSHPTIPLSPRNGSSNPSGRPIRQDRDVPERRPEKSAATASRLIAGALGVKVKMTEEQREYERVVREREKRRREAEKEKVKEEERRRAAVWED
jgi:hypothetical protein